MQKTIFYKYDEPIVGLFNYLFIDVIFEILLLIIFRPQSLPNYFNIDMGNLFDDNDDVRAEWDLGYSVDAKGNILKALTDLLVDLVENA